MITIEKTQLEKIKNALLSAFSYIDNDIEAICDEDYLAEAQQVLSQIEEALTLIKEK
jgi:regulator of sigma D